MEYKYKKIADDIRDKITAGTYAPGDILPEQSKIAKDYQTTRSTVHKALDLLMVEGMIYSKRGAGTFVRKDYGLENPKDSHGTFSLEKPLGLTFDNKGKKITSKVLKLSARLPTPEEIAKLLIEPEVAVYDIQRIRYLDDKLFAYEHTIMPTTITTLNKEVLNSSIYARLRSEGLKIEGSHRIIKADRATDLDIETGVAQDKIDPVLVIKRLSYLDDGQPFELSESRFPFESSELISDTTL